MRRLVKISAGRKTAAVAVATAFLLLAGIAPGSASSEPPPLGENFSFAEVGDSDTGTSAPAFTPSTVAFWAGVCDLHGAVAAIGALPAGSFPNCIDHPARRVPPLAPGVAPHLSGPDGWLQNPGELLGSGPSWRLADMTLGGGRPDGTASFWFARTAMSTGGFASPYAPDGAPRNISVSLPPGVIGYPTAVTKCQPEHLNTVPTTCPPKTQVGVSTVTESGVTYVAPVYNVEPRDGKTAEFVISGLGNAVGLATNAPVVARARTEGDFGVDAGAAEISAGVPLEAQTFTLWAVPWARSHDRYRPVAGYCGDGVRSFGMPLTGLSGGQAGGCSQAGQSYDPSWGPIRPFFRTQTECSPDGPVTSITADNWHTDVVATATTLAPDVTDCAALPFDAGLAASPTSTLADGPTGLDVKLTNEQNEDPPASVRFDPDDDTGAPAHWKSTAGRAVADLDKTVVTLPEGVSVNPAGATGLAGCSDERIGVTRLGNPPLFDNDDPFDGQGNECPQNSIIGSATVNTPLLEEPLTGELVLGNPRSTDPTSGEMFRLFIVVRNRERGLVAKIFGSTVADPATGRLTATFDNNPQVPFDDVDIGVKGGQRGMLALQQRCASRPWSAELTPWSAAHGAGGQPAANGGAFTTDQRCGFGFAPNLAAGMDNRQGRGNGTFSFRFSRQDGEQWFKGLTTQLPKGLLASVREVPLCTDAQASANACPASSRIGTVDAGAGSGDPFFLERKGDVYLTKGYKGGDYGLAVSVPVEAGPFRGQYALAPIVVRQAIHVDRTTAQVTAISDDFPRIWHGIPLRMREATVKIDRSRFMLNPSDCAAKQIDATLLSTEGASNARTEPFQAVGCSALPFKPRLALRLTGRKQVRTGKHPGIRATVTQKGIPEAGIEKAEVRLPKSLALDVDNAQALCEFDDGTKPDLENHCPKGSIVGRARAKTPLLKNDLTGNVYFVKNVRRSSTGNLIRTLPMIIVALRGEIAVNLTGKSSTTASGKLVNTFDAVPDAPVSRFNLNVKGGRNGILAVTRTRRAMINLCVGRHVAEADMDGHNGRRHDFDVKMRTPCTGAQRKAAFRRATRRR